MDNKSKIFLIAYVAIIAIPSISVFYAGGLSAFFRLSHLDDLRGPAIGFGYEAQFTTDSNRHCTYLAREANKVNYERNRNYIAYKASINFYDPFIDDQYDEKVRYDSFLAVIRHAINIERAGGNTVAQYVYKWCNEGRTMAIKKLSGG